MDVETSPDSLLDAVSLEERIMLSASPMAPELIPADSSDVQTEETAPLLSGETDQAQESVSLIFMDSSVPDHEGLQDLIDQREGSAQNTQLIVLDSDQDGIEQITDVLLRHGQVSSVHIISHGDDGQVRLGNTWLNQQTLTAHASQFFNWRDSLHSDADILFYGCDLAATEDGRELIESIAALTDADVAASDDLTGHASLGGDWDLEFASGTIESAVVFDEAAKANWQHVLNVTVDATSTGVTAENRGSDSVAHTTSGTDRLMLVGISFGQDKGEQVSSITYNGENLTLVGAQDHSADDKTRVEIWALLAPDLGTHNVVINYSDDDHVGATIGVMTFNGVDQASPLGVFSGAEGSSSNASTVVGSSTGETVFSVLAFDSGTDFDLSPDAGQTEYWDLHVDQANGAGSLQAGAASVTSSWSIPTSDRWSAAGVSIKPTTAPDSVLWFSTSGDVGSPSGVTGLDSWRDGEALQLGDPNLSFGEGTTDGTLSALFNLDNLVDDGAADLDALHFVTTNITIGSANAINLQYGDIIFSTAGDEVLQGGLFTLEKEDVGLFRPDSPGDFSSGTFSILLDDLSVGGIVGPNVQGITLVEQTTTFGDTTLNAGDFVYTHLDDFAANDIFLFEVDDVGEGTTSGTHRELIEGNDIGLSVFTSFLMGVELVETETTIGGTTLSAGTLLLQSNGTQTNVGNSNITTTRNDVMIVNVTDTTLVAGSAVADVSILLDGGNIGLNSIARSIDALAIGHAASNDPPVITLTPGVTTFTEGGAAVTVDSSAVFSDADSPTDLDSGSLTVTISAGGDTLDRIAIENQGTGTGQISISGSDVSYEGVQIGSFSGGNSTTPLVVTLNSNSTPAAAQALMRSITFESLAVDPDTSPRTISMVMTDGDGGTSNAADKTIAVAGDNILVVTTVSDTADGATSSIDALLADRGADGAISLREAILATNNTLNGTAADEIHFNIAGSGTHTISLASLLPTISDAVIIDGWTEPDYTGTPQIEIDGNNLSGSGLVLNSVGASAIRGLSIYQFDGHGINLQTGGHTIQGNYVGLAADGSTLIANTGDGIRIQIGADNNVIGGTTSSQTNVLSGNEQGIEINSSGNIVQGNYVGVDASGTLDRGNKNDGIAIRSSGSNNSIGGGSTGSGNLISGNDDGGIVIDNGSNNVVQGNYIGTDVTGTNAISNSNGGIRINSHDGGLLIGGSNAGEGNLVSGNLSHGIELKSSAAGGAQVLGNIIGMDATGVFAIANSGHGVLSDNSNSNIIGGIGNGEANLIAGNQGTGVAIIGTSTNNEIRGNRIFSNSGLGIDLEFDGVTSNDGRGDSDTGANNLQNFPTLVSATLNGSDFRVVGTLAAAANTTFFLDFYSSNSADSSGHGGAETYIGSTAALVSDGSGNLSFDEVFTGTSVTASQVITATATDEFGNTSEFALNLVPASNTSPTADIGGLYEINEGDTLNLDASASSDPELNSLSFAWDLNNDSVFGDVSGSTQTLSWSDLQTFGIDDDGSYTIGLRVSDGRGGVDTVSTTLTVNNVAPTLTLTGANSSAEGSSYTLGLGASDDGNDTITSWTINWGDGTIDTIAGNPASASHSYTQPGFAYNILVAASDEDGTHFHSELVVPSYAGNSIYRFDAAGESLGDFGSGSGVLKPVQAIVGPDGNTYVTGEDSDNVLRFDTAGIFLDEFIGAGSGGLNSPGGLAFGADGNLYVASFSTDQVLRYDGTTGAFIDAFVSAGSGGLDQAYGITFGPDGNLYVGSYNDNSVLRFDGTTGTFIDQFITSGSGGLDTPEQLTFGPDGNLYVASFGSNQVLRYDGATGAFLDVFASGNGLDSPVAASFGPDGHLYVSASANNTILRFNGSTGAFIDEFIASGTGGLSDPSMLAFQPGKQVSILTAVNSPPITDAGGTYTIDEGESITLDGSGSSDPNGDSLSFRWDLDNDGIFGESGEPTTDTPVISWATLQAFGIDDDLAAGYTIALQVDDGQGGVTNDTATVFVNNVAPTLSAIGDATASAGANYTLNLSATDQGDDTITGWTINWGDGTVDQIVGNPSTASHVYSGVGSSYDITVSATDEDGTYHQNELLVTGEISSQVLRFAPTTGDFAQQFAVGDGLSGHSAMRIGPDGLLYVGGGSDNVLRYNPHTGAFVDVFVPAGSGGLDLVEGMAFGPDGNLYVTSRLTNQVLKYDGTTGASLGVFVSGLNGVHGIQFGPDGNLYVANRDDHTIERYDGQTGAFLNDFVTTNSGGLSGPVDLVFHQGSLFVTSNYNDRVLQYDGTTGNFIGTFVSTRSGGMDGPIGLTFGPDGHLYVGSYSGDNVLRFDGTTGAFLDEYVPAGTNGLDGANFPVFVPSQQVRITNTAPTITSNGGGSTASINVDENSSFVSTVVATDPQVPSQSLTYTIAGGTDASLFTIGATSGTLSFLNAPDFEVAGDSNTDNVYEVVVSVEDGSGGSDQQTISVTVDPVNDNSPVFTTPINVSVDENTTAIQTVNATDADSPTQTVSYSITGGADAARFSIVSSSGLLSFSSAPDFESPSDVDANNVYEVEVTASDGAGNQTAQVIQVTVDPVDDNSPVFTSPSAVNSDENTTAVQTVTATDADLPSQTISYTITGGDDAAKFSIVTASGNLAFVTAPDFETPTDANTDNVYEVEITASDGAGNSTSQLLRVTVDPVNDNIPIFSSPASASVNENSSTILTVTATDADLPLQSMQYSITGGVDAGLFLINSSSGALQFASGPDFESPSDANADNIYELEITASDGFGATKVQAMTIAVTDVNESPFIQGPTVVDILEDAPVQNFDLLTWFGDVDSSDILSFSIQSNSQAGWTQASIDPLTNQLSLMIDSDRWGTAHLVLRATDSAGLFVDKTTNFEVAAVNDTFVPTDQVLVLDSADAIGGQLTNATVDADGESLQFIVTEPPANGSLTVQPDGSFEFQPTAGFVGTASFKFVVNDGVSISSEATVIVQVEPVAAPDISAPQSTTPPETADNEVEGQQIESLDVPVATLDANPAGSDPTLRSVSPSPSPNNEKQSEVDDDEELPVVDLESSNLVFSSRNEGFGNASSSFQFQFASTQLTTSPIAMLSQPGLLWDELDALIEDTTSDDFDLSSIAIGSVGTASSGLIVGYVVWALRSGFLLSSVMAAMPAWNLLDPLAIVSISDETEEQDDESLEELVENQKQKIKTT
ncbi:MAG: DUF4347 domain-containing protein [Planctomycetota bacterium]